MPTKDSDYRSVFSEKQTTLLCSVGSVGSIFSSQIAMHKGSLTYIRPSYNLTAHVGM